MFKTHLNFEDHFQELRSKEAAINDYRQIIVNTKCLRETVRWIFVVLIGSEVYSIVTYLLSENSDDGNSDCCASAVVTKILSPRQESNP